MSKIQNSCFVPALIAGAVIGFLLSFFNVFGVNNNTWIPIYCCPMKLFKLK